MKRWIGLILTAIMLLTLVAGCSSASQETAADKNPTEAGGMEIHKIGVAVYDVMDDEVVAFREYLEGYIEECFPEVDFYYSYSIRSKEDELQFLQDACAQGVEGILSFITYDLLEEVEYCESQGVYYMMASGTVAEEAFAQVEDNPYFLGVVGPGKKTEYEAGAQMANWFIEHESGRSFILFTGGASAGNEMHRIRSVGALEAIEAAFGGLGRSAEELAVVREPVKLTVGELKLTIFPGYTSREEIGKQAIEELHSTKYDVALSMFSMYTIVDELKADGTKQGVVDSYTQTNLDLFSDGVLCYVAGKFSSTIGPSFAAMYNAVTGYAPEFREDGKAFQIQQDFWVSDSKADYNEKYALATGIYVNAYNYEDLRSVMKVYDETADLEKLEALMTASSYEEAKNRRSE